MAVPLPTLYSYSGPIPDKNTMTDEEFADSIHPWLRAMNDNFIPSLTNWGKALEQIHADISEKYTKVMNQAVDGGYSQAYLDAIHTTLKMITFYTVLQEKITIYPAKRVGDDSDVPPVVDNGEVLVFAEDVNPYEGATSDEEALSFIDADGNPCFADLGQFKVHDINSGRYTNGALADRLAALSGYRKVLILKVNVEGNNNYRRRTFIDVATSLIGSYSAYYGYHREDVDGDGADETVIHYYEPRIASYRNTAVDGVDWGDNYINLAVIPLPNYPNNFSSNRIRIVNNGFKRLEIFAWGIGYMKIQ